MKKICSGCATTRTGDFFSFSLGTVDMELFSERMGFAPRRLNNIHFDLDGKTIGSHHEATVYLCEPCFQLWMREPETVRARLVVDGIRRALLNAMRADLLESENPKSQIRNPKADFPSDPPQAVGGTETSVSWRK